MPTLTLRMLYFSGTGNTDYVAHYLVRQLEHELDPVSLIIKRQSLEQQPPESVAGFDVLALGFPVYACDAPSFVQDYVARLAPGQGRGAFCFCTKGAYAGNAVDRNLERLAKRGYIPLGGGSVGMPGSDGLALLSKDSRWARMATEKDFDHLRDADRLATQIAADLSALANGASAASLARVPRRKLGDLIVDGLWAWIYDLFAEPWREKFWADDHCQGCGLCAAACPVGNIALDTDRLVFGDLCVLCLRCLHNCPQEAIQIGKMTVGKFRWRGPQNAFRPLDQRPGKGKNGS